MALATSKVEFLPSVHQIREFILHFVGQDGGQDDSDDQIACVFYNAIAPRKEFTETKRTQIPKEHYEAATLAIDRQNKEKDEFLVAVLFTLAKNKTPCKIIKMAPCE